MSAETAPANECAQSMADIRSRACPECGFCGTRGEILYTNLTDRLFDAPGHWTFRRCPKLKCGLVWLDPMPLEEDIRKAYETYFTHCVPENTATERPAPLPLRTRLTRLSRSAYWAWRYNYGPDAGKQCRWLLALPIILTRIECDSLDIPLRLLAVPTKGRMLDVGCGNGAVLELAQELGWQAEGVDFDPQAVESARRKGLSVKIGTLADQRYPDGLFDLVMMNHVIEHVHDPLDTLCEIRRIIRHGGRLAVTTPNADSWGHRHFGSSWAALDPPRHLRIFNGELLEELATRAGFVGGTIISTLRTTPFVFFQSRLIRSAGRGNMNSLKNKTDIRRCRAASLTEMFMRMWNRFAADELLLEAGK